MAPIGFHNFTKFQVTSMSSMTSMDFYNFVEDFISLCKFYRFLEVHKSFPVIKNLNTLFKIS